MDTTARYRVQEVLKFLCSFWVDNSTYGMNLDTWQSQSDSKIEENLNLIMAGLNLTDTAIEYGFTKVAFNEDFLVYLIHIFAFYIKKEKYFSEDVPIGKFFMNLKPMKKFQKI